MLILEETWILNNGVRLKEKIYQGALAEEFLKRDIEFKEQKRINIYSIESSKVLGTYVPDFIVDGKMIIEIKATDFVSPKDIRQQQSYLKASTYEIAYPVDFCTDKLYIKRSICTNDKKPFIVKIRASWKFVPQFAKIR